MTDVYSQYTTHYVLVKYIIIYYLHIAYISLPISQTLLISCTDNLLTAVSRTIILIFQMKKGPNNLPNAGQWWMMDPNFQAEYEDITSHNRPSSTGCFSWPIPLSRTDSLGRCPHTSPHWMTQSSMEIYEAQSLRRCLTGVREASSVLGFKCQDLN